MSPQSIPIKQVIRGYGHRTRHGTWIAVCIDLDLVVERPTWEEAMAAMRQQIVSYVKAVLDTEDKESIAYLLPRPVPLPERLKYYFIRAVCWFRQLKRVVICFTEPLCLPDVAPS